MKLRKGLSYVNTYDTAGENLKLGVLYNTEIFREAQGKITLSNGGWSTNHTKNCMNDLLPQGFYVFQKDFKWYLSDPQGNNVEFDANGKVEVHYA